MTLPDRLPLFPLPDAVLFPDVYLPLHIFEQCYRALTRHALDGNKLIGMTVLRDGWQGAPGATPPIYMTGCAGTIVHHEALEDGRFNIVLQGVARFEVAAEVDDGTSYRIARVRWLAEPDATGDLAALTTVRRQIEALLLPALTRGEVRMPPRLSDQALVNAISQALDVPVLEKLALLEKPTVLTRGHALLPLLERRLIQHGGDGSVH